jgi:small subunit ribosomal protein S21
MQVIVRDNNVEQALRVLKKKMQREGVFREMKRASFYEKPSEKSRSRKVRSDSSCSQAGPETSHP